MEKASDFDDTMYSPESIKVCAESIGIARLSDEIAEYLSKEVTFRLKHIIQNAAKYMNHGSRSKLSVEDIGYALKQMNVENLYGCQAYESLSLRYASKGKREVHFLEEKEIDLNDLARDLENSNTKIPIPVEVTVRAEWLAINDIPPKMHENPPPVSKDLAGEKSVEPLNLSIPKPKFKKVESVQIKPSTKHELSAEQQFYYDNITDACMGFNPRRRNEALESLATDPDLYRMLPYLSTFIKEGVRYNIVENNLAYLIYLMQMVKALSNNETISLEKYLHELIPSVISCIVAKQLCARPEKDNHWALRDFAARLLAQICKKFNSSTNNIKTRITHLISKRAFGENEELPLTSLYGTLEGLSELGPQVITDFILPKVKFICARIESHLEVSTAFYLDRLEAFHIKKLLLKVLPPVLINHKAPPYFFEDFKDEYGYLGQNLYTAVLKAISQQAKTVSKYSPSLEVSAYSRKATGLAVVASQQTATSTRSSVIISPTSASTSAKNPKKVGFQSILKPKREDLHQQLAVDGVPNSTTGSSTPAIYTQEPTQTANINLEKLMDNLHSVF